jgi:hypothetical protein
MCRFHRENIEKIKIIKIKNKGGRKATPPDEIVNFSATGRRGARESLSTDTQSREALSVSIYLWKFVLESGEGKIRKKKKKKRVEEYSKYKALLVKANQEGENRCRHSLACARRASRVFSLLLN